jgi:soluble lytic murein transglycosylase-like protein
MRLSLVIAATLAVALAAPVMAVPPSGDAHRQDFVRCMARAAQRYKLDPLLLMAVKQTESGNRLDPRLVSRNRNGSADYCLMQINSIWLPKLQRYGIGVAELQQTCPNIQAGAWILATSIQQHGLVEGIGRYHSATTRFKVRYQTNVLRAYAQLRERSRLAELAALARLEAQERALGVAPAGEGERS